MNRPHRRRFHEWRGRHTRLIDALFALALLVPVFTSALNVDPEGSERNQDLVGGILVVLAVVPVAFRRSHTAPALVVSMWATLTYFVLDYPDPGIGFAAMVLLYSAGALLPRREAYRLGALSIGATTVVVITGLIVSEEDLGVANAFVTVVMFAAAYLLGDTMRNRRAYLAELELRAEESDQRREEEAKRAAVEERTRIAREMHDVVAHSMSVMVVQAAGARRVMASDPEQAAAALESIEGTGREALQEMRAILGVLREGVGGGTRAPLPGLSALPALVEGCEAAGVTVELELEGGGDLPVGLDLAAYRIVQEALTNVIKHAGPSHATVRVRTAADVVELEVVDDGRGASASVDRPAADGPGHGIEGMRERAELHGGTLDAGPQPGGGFAVRARLPLVAGTASGASTTSDRSSTATP